MKNKELSDKYYEILKEKYSDKTEYSILEEQLNAFLAQRKKEQPQSQIKNDLQDFMCSLNQSALTHKEPLNFESTMINQMQETNRLLESINANAEKLLSCLWDINLRTL